MMDPETEEWLRPRNTLFDCSVESLPPLPSIFKVNLYGLSSLRRILIVNQDDGISSFQQFTI